MNTTSLTKTDFIKFNVSPTFKALAQKKAAVHGMSLSELGRMLFGAFVIERSHIQVSQKFIRMAQQAKREYREGKTISFRTIEEMKSYLDSI